MNCLEFRRHCLAEPGNRDSTYLRHKGECESCAGFAAHVGQVDKQLSDALHVDVPENLASRIILRQSLAEARAWPTRRWSVYTVAAGVLLAVGLAGFFINVSRAPSFERAVVTHLDSEWNRLVAERDGTQQNLVRVLGSLGGELKGELGDIRHASLCDFAKEGGAHLVLDGRKGPVVVLLLPNNQIEAPRAVATDQFDGSIVPTNHGSMVVIGAEGEDLQGIARKVRSAVVWRS
jgi:hypothetical protein